MLWSCILSQPSPPRREALRQQLREQLVLSLMSWVGRPPLGPRPPACPISNPAGKGKLELPPRVGAGGPLRSPGSTADEHSWQRTALGSCVLRKFSGADGERLPLLRTTSTASWHSLGRRHRGGVGNKVDWSVSTSGLYPVFSVLVPLISF